METALDRAHAAMAAAPADDALRLRFHERVADAELYLMLAEEPAGDDRLKPEVFRLEEGGVVLAFDRAERLGGFAGRPVPYAALSGRALARMLAAEDLGIGLNFGAPSETLLPAATVQWLAATLGTGPAEVDAQIAALRSPGGLPEHLIAALAEKLALAEGMAQAAWLAGVRYADGRHGHMLAFVDAVPGAEPALAAAVSEALIFSGVEAGELDVTFTPSASPLAARLARAGLAFEIPRPDNPGSAGDTPLRPPRLR